ncbi:MAG: MmcQ/YjbR family DNA-binding protein [Bacteroidales bacterium]|nr:MmcQ/YjbR family DNA-binding protein [Bacteroidales bacterium]
MNIEDVREYCLSLPGAMEDLFAPDWLSFRIGGKWFAILWLGAPRPTVEVKLLPERGEELRERYAGVSPGYHMNKRHWNNLVLDSGLTDQQVKEWISESYHLVRGKLPKSIRQTLKL